MSFEITSGYCPKCKCPVEYDEETEVCRCTNPSCDWEQRPNIS
jgi:hypothetical protein